MTYFIALLLLAVAGGAFALKKYNKQLTAWALSKQRELKSEGVQFPDSVERKVALATRATQQTSAGPALNKFGVPLRKTQPVAKKMGRKESKRIKENQGSVV